MLKSDPCGTAMKSSSNFHYVPMGLLLEMVVSLKKQVFHICNSFGRFRLCLFYMLPISSQGMGLLNWIVDKFLRNVIYIIAQLKKFVMRLVFGNGRTRYLDPYQLTIIIRFFACGAWIIHFHDTQHCLICGYDLEWIFSVSKVISVISGELVLGLLSGGKSTVYW